jgi:hypothetical protein
VISSFRKAFDVNVYD